MKVDELLEQERQLKSSMTNRAGVVGLLLHSTYNHELEGRRQAQQQRAAQAAAAAAAQQQLHHHHQQRKAHHALKFNQKPNNK